MSRHPEILNRHHAGLLIVDIQERIASVMLHRQQVIDNTVKMIKACRIMNVPVFITEQYPRGLGPTESAVSKALDGITSRDKMTFSCCGIADLTEDIKSRGIEQVIITGIEAHVCVQQTALDLLALGFQVHVLRDCVSSRKEIDFETALERLRSAGTIISTVEAAIFELLEKAGTPEFKEVARLVK